MYCRCKKLFFFLVAENFVILWKRMKDNAIMAMGETVLVENERISVEINSDGPNKGSTLVIPLAEEKDAGQYVCQMANGEQKKLKHTVQIRGNFKDLCWAKNVGKCLIFNRYVNC